MIVYKFFRKIRNIKIRILWNSMKKNFYFVGKRTTVAELPDVLNPKNISIGNCCFFGKEVRLEAWKEYLGSIYDPRISIGDNVVLTDRAYLSCINEIIIGNNTLIGRDVFITDNSHGDFSAESLSLSPANRPLTSKGPVIIGKNVWIGRNVTILSGVTIGDNVIIGANSLVNKSLPSNCLAYGTPAKIAKVFE